MYNDIHANKLSLKNIFYYNRQRKTYVELAISLIIIVVFLIFALIPTIGTIDKVKESIEKYEEIKEKQKRILDQGRKLESLSNEEIGSLSQEIQYLHKIVPNQTDIRLIYVNIYNRARKTNTVIKSIKLNEPKSSISSNIFLSSKSLEVELQLENNSINDLNQFIKQIEGPQAFPFPSMITKVNIQDPNIRTEESSNNTSNNQNQEENSARNIQSNLTMLLFFPENANFTN
ncbi:MAG: hypothetical protein N3A71_02640 [Candidatus Dojkabacteria bacterium]|nr:hypothetical protein [Candidatus Dojkabacteria bacterium]